MRQVRPGETPVFGSVWQWTATGDPILALRVVQLPSSWGERYFLVGLRLPSGGIDSGMIWSGPALVGMGPVLTEWYCVSEALDVPAD